MRATLEILRFDSHRGGGARRQAYEVEMPDGSTVLEALMKVQDEQDGTLSFRRACRHGICGSCGMRINGCARLACNTQLSFVVGQARQMREARAGKASSDLEGSTGADADSRVRSAAAPVRIEPLGNMPVIKDLVTDMDAFWRKVRRTRPYLFPPSAPPDPDTEYLVSPAESDRLAQGVLCVECGVCFSDCTAVQATPEFIGPTALVKAHRYATDPRDNDSHHRLAELSDQHGLWECVRCYFCSERCPKHIRVRDLIAQLGEMACAEALRTDPGARHAEAFITSLREGGRLNEAKLPVQSQGWVWTLQRLPMVVRIALAGKLQLPLSRRIDDHDSLLRVMGASEDER